MPNIASILKTEISRIARKEVRTEVLSHKKAASTHRTEISALKRRVQALEQAVRRLSRGSPKPPPATADDAKLTGLRFSAKGFASHRNRLGLSAHDCGLLIGVTGQSVYQWEEGKTRPRARHLPAIAALRSMGKRAAQAQLASLR